MALFEHTAIFSLLLILMTFLMFIINMNQNRRSVILINWPIIGMVPGLVLNTHRIHDYMTEILTQTDGTFMFKGPWFANMDMLITTNPLDVRHVLFKNFNNYPKGDKFRNIFDIFGDGILTSEGPLWDIQRKITTCLFKHANYQSLLETVIWDKLENGLLPILESISNNAKEIDLQELFDRFTFDNTCKLLLDHDPESLSLDLPYVSCQKAPHDVGETIFHRHYTPQIIWKLKQLLRWSDEKNFKDAWKTLDDFIYKCLIQKQNDCNKTNDEEHEEGKTSLLTTFMIDIKDQCGDFGEPTKILRDMILSLMLAGKDTISSALSWFFYLLAKNPIVEEKILEEICIHLEVNVGERWSAKDGGEMVYLNGALNESLRLFPPIPLNHKSPLQPEILPSGHKVDRNMQIFLCFYSMGRMKSIWGEDCMEFKPERWISSTGRIKHEPSYKFTTFNAGPRSCLGKDMSLSQMKIVTSTIIYRYHIELVEGSCLVPADSIVLKMKHGLKVRLTKRSQLRGQLNVQRTI
ncbi:alkane hydroxylase MAH1-like [Rutidosis leptorrhynchoides]|uniref:alkane hydroxylase MAH1-like n=1 Tax=Rutidosis leptorrhynchoides TaxID=125765 RepID=UPI003A98F6FD